VFACPHPTGTLAPHAPAGHAESGVQQLPLSQISPLEQLEEQSMVPPHPSSTTAAQAPAAQVLGVQQAPFRQTSPFGQFEAQSMVPPHPSSIPEPHDATSLQVFGAHAQTPVSHGPWAQSVSTWHA
jgi:hypothetical protein